MRKQLALYIAIAGILVGACSKLNPPDTATAEQDTVTIMGDSLALPVPDGSYSETVSSFATMAGANATALLQDVNVVASPLREENSKFGQFLREGTRNNGSLDISHTGLSATLKGVRDDQAGTIDWTYTKSGSTYFSGKTSNTGTTGDLTFPASALSLKWSFSSGLPVTRTITVRKSAGSYLEFKLTYTNSATPTKVELSGKVDGVEIAGEWVPNGLGQYSTGGGAPKCWDGRLQDRGC